MSTEHKRDYSISMLRANLLALVIGLPVAIAQLSLFVFLHGALRVTITLPGARRLARPVAAARGRARGIGGGPPVTGGMLRA